MGPAEQPPNMTEELQIRIHYPDSHPTLVYLPGLHGDWTLVAGFRAALKGRVRFVELTYPRTLTWSLDEYAAAVEQGLLERGISRGWMLAESFGSQVLWALLARRRFLFEGVILAGGFVRHPVRRAVRMGERLAGGVSLTLLTRLIFGYAKIARFRYRHSPEVLSSLREFIVRRTELDRQAAKHRLRLVAENDPSAIVREAHVPIYALTGLADPIVPWFWVRSWLRRHCPALREYRIIWPADHNILGTAPEITARHVLRWMAVPL